MVGDAVLIVVGDTVLIVVVWAVEDVVVTEVGAEVASVVVTEVGAAVWPGTVVTVTIGRVACPEGTEVTGTTIPAAVEPPV